MVPKKEGAKRGFTVSEPCGILLQQWECGRTETIRTVWEGTKGMLLALATFVLIGTIMTAQAPVTAALQRELGGPVSAVALCFAVGAGVLAGVALLPGGGDSVTEIPRLPVPILVCTCAAAWYVLHAIWGVSTMGILTLMSALILGQMTAAHFIDATGVLGIEVNEVTPKRVATAGLVLASLILSRA
jgi:bacterial/archaeal transporter family-2 protein